MFGFPVERAGLNCEVVLLNSKVDYFFSSHKPVKLQPTDPKHYIQSCHITLQIISVVSESMFYMNYPE